MRHWKRVLLCLVVLVAVRVPLLAADSGPAFDPQEATEAYLNTLTQEERARSDRYFEGGYWLLLLSFLVNLAVAWALLGGGRSAKIRDRMEKLTRRRPVQTALYVAVYVLVTTVLPLPFIYYRDHFRQHQYGLSNQSLGAWLAEQGTVLLVNLVLFGILASLIYGVIRRTGGRWWIWGAGVTVLFLIVGQLLAPVYILPLFNDYTPLEDGPVRDAVLSLARANGVPVDEVYVYDQSRQSNRISAHVSGFAGTMRISLGDNLLKRGNLGDVKAVMAHELGHYVLNHPMEGVIEIGLLLAGGFAFVGWGFERVRRRWGSSWGIRDVGDVAGMPLLMALFFVYFFVATPALNTVIRSNEAEADAFGINASREPDGRARTALMHAEDRKMAPGGLEEWLFFDHPSGRNRILMAMRWKAENHDEVGADPASD